MKTLLSLLAFNFLCIWCFGFEDCEGQDISCGGFSPVLPQLAAAIPYRDGETLRYRFSDDTEVLEARISQFELSAGGEICQDGIEASIVSDEPGRAFRILLSTDVFGLSSLHFDFFFGTEDRQSFFINYDESGSASVFAPLNGRTIADTTIANVNYRDVFAVSFPESAITGDISACYYNTQEGIIRLERVNEPAVTLAQ